MVAHLLQATIVLATKRLYASTYEGWDDLASVLFQLREQRLGRKLWLLTLRDTIGGHSVSMTHLTKTLLGHNRGAASCCCGTILGLRVCRTHASIITIQCSSTKLAKLEELSHWVNNWHTDSGFSTNDLVRKIIENKQVKEENHHLLSTENNVKSRVEGPKSVWRQPSLFIPHTTS